MCLLSSPQLALHTPPSFPTRRSSDLRRAAPLRGKTDHATGRVSTPQRTGSHHAARPGVVTSSSLPSLVRPAPDRKSTRLNSSHLGISYAVFCLKKKISSASAHRYKMY